MASPLLSIIVPVFNRASLVRETLSCLVEQDYRPVELIVVDDCSTDGTVEAVRRFIAGCEARNVLFKLIALRSNGGAAQARNAGLRAAGGAYVFFNDSDDLVGPRKLRLQVEALEADGALDFVYGPTQVLETGVAVYGASHLDCLDACIRQLRSPFLHTLGPVFRRSFLERAGSWDPNLPCCQDWEFHLRLTYQRPRYRWVPEAVAYYRSRGQGTEGRVSANETPGQGPGQRLVRGQYERIVSALDHAPDWALRSLRFRSSLRWNAYRVASLCLRGGATDLAEDILARLSVRNRAACFVERVGESAAAGLFRLSTRWFRAVFDSCDFVYYRFHGLARRLHRARLRSVPVRTKLLRAARSPLRWTAAP